MEIKLRNKFILLSLKINEKSFFPLFGILGYFWSLIWLDFPGLLGIDPGRIFTLAILAMNVVINVVYAIFHFTLFAQLGSEIFNTNKLVLKFVILGLVLVASVMIVETEKLRFYTMAVIFLFSMISKKRQIHEFEENNK